MGKACPFCGKEHQGTLVGEVVGWSPPFNGVQTPITRNYKPHIVLDCMRTRANPHIPETLWNARPIEDALRAENEQLRAEIVKLDEALFVEKYRRETQYDFLSSRIGGLKDRVAELENERNAAVTKWQNDCQRLLGVGAVESSRLHSLNDQLTARVKDLEGELGRAQDSARSWKRAGYHVQNLLNNVREQLDSEIEMSTALGGRIAELEVLLALAGQPIPEVKTIATTGAIPQDKELSQ